MDPSQISTQESDNVTSQPEASGSKPKSDLFVKHMSKGPTEANGRIIVSCRHCIKTFNWKTSGGYGTLTRHVNSVHPDKVGLLPGQTQISAGFATSNNPLFRYDHESSSVALAEAICVDHLAFQFSENLGFNDYMVNHVQPSYKLVSRKVIKKNVIKAYKRRKAELVAYFSQNDLNVSICSDIWSDHGQTNSYMGVTCHFIDRHFNMQKRLLAFRVFNDSHTAQNIAMMIRTILEEYRLLNRVFSIGFDNASSNTASIRELSAICQPLFGGRFFHIRCACHILNLCVQDGLSAMSYHFDPIKDVIKYIWGHTKVTKDWMKFCKENGVHPKRFSKDVGTRWNSTYILLCECIQYKQVLTSFVSQNVTHLYFNEANWDVCQKIAMFLKCFSDATKRFSHVYIPSGNVFVLEACNIMFGLSEGAQIPGISESVMSMRHKWLNYYTYIPDCFLVACVFDPRFKLSGLQDMLENYYSMIETEEEVDVIGIVSRTRTHIETLYSHFSNSSSSSQIPPSSSSLGSSLGAFGAKYFSKRPRVSNSNAEIDNYFNTNFEFSDIESLDVLKWWEDHKSMFPTLLKILAQVLAVPASTVAVEQTFSQGGHILSRKRSNLTPESLEAQVCVCDWKKAGIREQRNMNPPSDKDEWVGDATTINTESSAEESS